MRKSRRKPVGDAAAAWSRILAFLGAATLLWPAGAQAALIVGQLRCEYLDNPQGIDVRQPRLHWVLTSADRGDRQSAYQVVVATTPEKLNRDEGDLWDSGKVASDDSTLVPYGGKPLVTFGQCFWKVRAWDRDGSLSPWSEPGRWSMGLLAAEDWAPAQWIGAAEDAGKDPSAPEDRRLPARYLRKEFALNSAVRRATVAICGLGVSELSINGKKVGDHVLSPAVSEYPKRMYYVTHDVTDFVRRGQNAVGVILGNGRYYAPRQLKRMPSYGFPKLLLHLRMELDDGSVTTVVSDLSWKLSTQGPILANNEYDGEEYDARRSLAIGRRQDSTTKRGKLQRRPWSRRARSAPR